MRIIFMGTPQFAVPALEALIAAGHELVAAYTQPPRPGGRRGRELTPSPVQLAAQAHGIAVRHPVSLKGAEEQAAFAALEADVAVVAAYGLILPQAVLDAPEHGCINIHASLLPRWRGAAPIQRAILAGDEDVGVCIMQMEAGLDTGPVRLCKKSWFGNDNAGKVTQRLAELGAKLVVKVLSDPGAFPPVPQPEDGVTYARKIEKHEARLDFTQSADVLSLQVRAFAPTPGAFFEFQGERVRVLSAYAINRDPEEDTIPGVLVDRVYSTTHVMLSIPLQPYRAVAVTCGEGYLKLNVVQPGGKQPMQASAFIQGRQYAVGKRLA